MSHLRVCLGGGSLPHTEAYLRQRGKCTPAPFSRYGPRLSQVKPAPQTSRPSDEPRVREAEPGPAQRTSVAAGILSSALGG